MRAIDTRHSILRRTVLLDRFRSRRLLSKPLQGTLYFRWDGWRGREMGTGHLGAEFIGGPAYGDRGSVRRVVLNGALDELRLVFSAGVLATAGFLLDDSTRCLISEGIMSAVIAEILRVTHDPLRFRGKLAVDQSKQGYTQLKM